MICKRHCVSFVKFYLNDVCFVLFTDKSLKTIIKSETLVNGSKQIFFSSGHSASKMVRFRGRLQRNGDGTVGSLTRRSLQFLFTSLLP